jgi:hypothetical protein
MKKSCCRIFECTDFAGIENCDDCRINSCCGKIEICAQNASKSSCEHNKKTIIKICENAFNELIKKMKCDIKSDHHEIVGCVLIGIYFYIYIQLKHGYKNNMLCVIQGKLDATTLIAINDSLNIQMCYNLYNSVKNACLDKKLAKHLKITQVLYNPYDDLFILLINSDDKTILGKIEHLEAIHSVGTSIDFIYTDSCHLLVIDNIPICICAISRGKYKITVFDKCEKYNKSYMMCF